ncbi:PrgI family protein [Nocardiopsis coralli]|nr:PrgI family protein [Nocardiopsis coralli]
MSRIRMPADVEREDQVLAGLTVRQLLIIGVPGLAIWAGISALSGTVPMPVLIVAGVPLIGAAVAAALVRRDGLSLDQLVWAAVGFVRAPKRRATHTSQPAPLPSWVNAHTPPLPAPLQLPLERIGDDGTLDLGEYGTAVVLDCSTVNFSLRTETEQDALVGGFGSFLNSLSPTNPVQILVRAESVRLDPVIAAVDAAAPTLPHPALQNAATAHADFLSDLARTRDLLYRQVLLVLRQPAAHGRSGAATVRRRAEDAARALAAAGSSAHVLDGPAVAAVLASAAAPTGRPPPPEGLAPPEAVITAPPPQGEEEHVHA